MKLIAHRALLSGPDKKLENNPITIKECLSKGYDCEVDVWYKNHRFYLGHDLPTYEVDLFFLNQPGLWIHAKNLECLEVLSENKNLNYFWHQEDDFTLTSHGYIWTYPGKPLTPKSIAVLPEWSDPELLTIQTMNCFGICSDYIFKIEEILDKKYS